MIDFENSELLNENRISLKESSKDISGTEGDHFMTESELEVVDFDSVKTKYLASVHCSDECAKSVDALFHKGNEDIFVEFKNGQFNKKDILLKAKDSLLILSAITGKNIDYYRENTIFILVYNEAVKNSSETGEGKNIQHSVSRSSIQDAISKKANTELIRFGLDRLKKAFFKDVHTYTANQFDGYLNEA